LCETIFDRLLANRRSRHRVAALPRIERASAASLNVRHGVEILHQIQRSGLDSASAQLLIIQRRGELVRPSAAVANSNLATQINRA
jgi:hypothetical protein